MPTFIFNAKVAVLAPHRYVPFESPSATEQELLSELKHYHGLIVLNCHNVFFSAQMTKAV